jgi:hypothetical protein
LTTIEKTQIVARCVTLLAHGDLFDEILTSCDEVRFRRLLVVGCDGRNAHHKRNQGDVGEPHLQRHRTTECNYCCLEVVLRSAKSPGGMTRNRSAILRAACKQRRELKDAPVICVGAAASRVRLFVRALSRAGEPCAFDVMEIDFALDAWEADSHSYAPRCSLAGEWEHVRDAAPILVRGLR